MSVLAVGDRVRLITQQATPPTYGVIDAKQAGVYRVMLENGETILCQRGALAFQNKALTAKRGAA